MALLANLSQAALLPTDGDLPVNPEIRLKPTVQRSVFAANVGWRFRHRIQVTNTGNEAWVNHPYPLNIGVTTDEVTATTMLASGNDIRVWHNGKEIPRTLNSHNVAATACLVWIVMPFLDVGASVVYDVLYGNPSAGAPPTLTTLDDLPAFDIATTGASRALRTFWRYNVDRTVGNAGKGGWQLSSGTEQPTAYFGAPGSWQLAATKPSTDDRKQAAWATYVATGTKYQGRFNAIRARSDSLSVDENSGADGVSIRVPAGIVSVRCDLRVINLAAHDSSATPVGRVVIMARSAEGDPWTIIHQTNTLQLTEATVATATYNCPSGTKEVAFAVWPYDGYIVEEGARSDRYVYGAWFTTLELTLTDVATEVFLETAQEVYELAEELRYGGGGDAVAIPPYTAIRLGNALEASGEGVPRLACKLNETVRIFTAQRRCEIWNTAFTAKVEDVPFDAVSAVDGYAELSGVTAERPSVSWIILDPVVNPLENPSFDADILDWTVSGVSGLVTDVRSWDVSVGVGSLKHVISGSSLGSALTVLTETPDGQFPLGDKSSVWFAFSFRVSALTTFRARGVVNFFDAAGGFLLQVLGSSWNPGAINTFQRRVMAAAAPAGAAVFSVSIFVTSLAASANGSFWFDDAAINDTELVYLSVNRGTVVLSWEYQEKYAGG